MKHHFAFDLDGTVTKHEVLPIIAKELGIEEEMALLTRRTMDGEIPFEHSFTMRVDMLKAIPISDVQHIVAQVPLSERIVAFIQEHTDRCHIVTGNLNVWIKLLTEKIGCNVLSSDADFENDTLKGIKKILRKKDIHTHVTAPVVAIGDGNNDVEMLMHAPVSIAYGGVHAPAPTLLEVSHYAIYDEKTLCDMLKRLS
ncbi:HAD family phosphatase [Candidatus Woesebacteria bacterium]|nr:HAD family phosphatase [Candidatus Woesebacteria bacterium]